MAYRIKADILLGSSLVVQGKNTGTSITTEYDNKTYSTDSTGAITVPAINSDDLDYILREFPLSQYGNLYDNSTISTSSQGFTLKFNNSVELFMAGNYNMLTAVDISLNTVTVSPANKTFYVYAEMILGVPHYGVYDSEMQESETSMFIGTVQTNASGISSININKVSRFGLYRPSTTQKGSAFPVSTGKPSDTGTIGW